MATTTCFRCGYGEVAHEQAIVRMPNGNILVHNVVEERRCEGFVEHGPWDRDSFYCGCRGWD